MILKTKVLGKNLDLSTIQKIFLENFHELCYFSPRLSSTDFHANKQFVTILPAATQSYDHGLRTDERGRFFETSHYSKQEQQ